MAQANSLREGFVFDFSLPTKIYFGAGEVTKLPVIINQHNDTALLLHDSVAALAKQVADVRSLLNTCCSHVDTVSLPDKGAIAENVPSVLSSIRHPPEIIVALGGGAIIDTAKIISLALSHGGQWPNLRIGGSLGTNAINRCIPLIAISTLAGTGTEISPAALIIRNKRKELFVSDHLSPQAAIVDPQLARTATPEISVRTAIDALVQGIEAYCTPGANLFSDLLALEAVRRTAGNLNRIFLDPEDLEARTNLAFAALVGNLCIRYSGGVGAAHGLSNPLSAHYGLHHGLTVSLLLPSVMRFNGPPSNKSAHELALALNLDSGKLSDDVLWEAIIKRVEQLKASVKLERSLRECGVPQQDFVRLGLEASTDPDSGGNPRAVTPEVAASLYNRVW